MFKRLLLGFCSLLVLAIPAYAEAPTYQGYPVVNVVVNGKPVQGDVPAISMNGRTLLPVRAIAEALGAQVQWDEVTHTATLTSNSDGQAQVAVLQTTVQHLSERLKAAGLPYQDPIPSAPQPDQGSRLNPYPIGSTVTLSGQGVTAKASLLKVVRGADCWTMVHQANQFNTPAPAGKEYLCAQFSSSLVAASDPSTADSVDWRHWTAVSNNVDAELPVQVPPQPEYQGRMYAGGTVTGWGVYQVDQNDSAPLIVFGRDFKGAGGYWFKTTQ